MDNEQRDFDYLTQTLADIDIQARYDRVTLVPGRDLWQQIGQQIVEEPLDGWAYLPTPASIVNQRCREELTYALGRALNSRGRDFPLIGLLHQVAVGYRRRYRVTTNSDHRQPVFPNRLEREFTVSAPNRVWVSDIRYV